VISPRDQFTAIRGHAAKGVPSVLSTLFAGDFDAYFAASGASNPLWLFVHVPKTAGSSMSTEMMTVHKPSCNIEIDYSVKSDKTYKELFDEAVDRFIARHREVPFEFANGHLQARNTEIIRRAIPNTRCFTMLRNPVARIISDYRYQRSELNVARADFVARTPDFAAYVARPFVHNKTAIALVPRPIVLAGDGPAAVEYVMKNYDFVGLQEMYPLSFRAVTTLMGHPRASEVKIRVNAPTEENQVVLNADEDAELRKLNAVDIALFQAFTQKWKPIRDDLRNYLNAHGRKAA
jgi:hypothetical protein